MGTESEILQSWRDCWNQCFPDCPADDNHLQLLRRQWKQFSGAQIGDALRKTAKKWKAGELVLDEDDELQHLLARYTRGILNRTAGKAAPPQPPQVTPQQLAEERAARAKAEQARLAAEQEISKLKERQAKQWQRGMQEYREQAEAREKAEGEAARWKALLAERLKHRDITPDAYVAELCREADELAKTGVIAF